MNRINMFHTPSNLKSVAWGKANSANNTFDATSPLIFAALLVACSLTVGCSSDKSKPIATPETQFQPMPPITAVATPPAIPAPQPEAKSVHKKIVHKAPATSTYTDKASGVSFQYPRKYALKTGEAASELVSPSLIPMDFVQPGGETVAAIAIPKSTYPNSDFASAFFDVSVNKTVSADQCGEFSVPQPNQGSPADPTVQATAQLATPPISKLMIGDMELQSSETSIGGQTTNGPREETAKYFHVFQNGACYEFALKVATSTPNTSDSVMKQVDRDGVFQRLEKILATVKFSPLTTPEVNAEVKTVAPVGAPAQ